MSKKTTSASEYRDSKRKEVELPSVLPDGSHPIFIIGKPGPRVAMKILDVLNIGGEEPEELGPEEATERVKESLKGVDVRLRAIEMIDILIPGCLVSPRVTLEHTNDVNLLHIDDIEISDQFFLLDAIMEFSGLTQEKAEDRKFPSKQSTRKTGK